MKAVVSKITDENRDDLFRLALSMYLGEACPYCGNKFLDYEDLKDAVWNGYTEWGRIAHRSCFYGERHECP